MNPGRYKNATVFIQTCLFYMYRFSLSAKEGLKEKEHADLSFSHTVMLRGSLVPSFFCGFGSVATIKLKIDI